jgi:serine/threonine protein phosphatase PrpC
MKEINTTKFENHFIIDIPKEKSAEDAPPLFIVSSDRQRYAIGVFDGMGGSGSALYEENEETHTGAYLASREAKNAVEQFFNTRFDAGNFSFTANDIELLKENIIEKLKEKLDKQQYEKSNIKSSLIRTFPTTMAVGLISVSNATAKIKTLWAGDSRVYCLSAKKGLVQLTKDDLQVENDPFQNIKNDSRLSNMLNLDNNFSINFKESEEKIPAVFFAATDGCFQFFSTPMHVEHMLLQTLQEANSMDEWKQKISEILKNISGDD